VQAGGVPYYNDDNLMEIVDYSVPTGQGSDITSPNSTQASTGIVSQAPVSKVVEQSIFVTERRGPLLLTADDQLEVLNLIEAGEIISIEVVSDNPFTSVYLELDDFKNREPNGITAAELLSRGRDEYAEREFFAEDRQKDGTYVLKYHPRKPDKYSDKIRLNVRNDLRRMPLFDETSDSKFLNRGGLPTPQHISFMAGGTMTVPHAKNILKMDNEAFANTLVKNPEPYYVNIPNYSVLENTMLETVPFNPYVGEAGKISISHIATAGATQPFVVFVESGATTVNGVDLSTIPTMLPKPWPGCLKNNAYTGSRQAIIIYGDNTETLTTNIDVSGGVSIGSFPATGVNNKPMVFRNGSELYFPGRLVESYVWQGGVWRPFPDPSIYNVATDGAILYIMNPGLDFKPPNMELTDDTDENLPKYVSFGLIENARQTPSIYIKEIIVRRRRTKYLNG